VPLPISRSALDRLGQRLAVAQEISDEDYLLLERVLNSYDEAMGRVQSRLTAFRMSPAPA
jgi:hypothetical protein